MKKALYFLIIIVALSCEIEDVEPIVERVIDTVYVDTGVKDTTVTGDTLRTDTTTQVPPKTKVGLFYSQAEVDKWKERSQFGPYRSSGDAGVNAPGEWERIVENKNRFLNNASQERWTINNTSCVQKNDDEPLRNHKNMLDAAFYYLVTDDQEVGEKVKNELLGQSGEPSMDWNNRSVWCYNVLYDIQPSFLYSEWLTRLLYAYDFTKDLFTDGEQDQMRSWFVEAAYYWSYDSEKALSNLFVDRDGGNYTLSSAAKAPNDSETYTHIGGYRVYRTGRFYNNRRLNMLSYAGQVGALFNDPALISKGKKAFKEWLMFNVFPDGIVGEFHRGYGSSRSPEAGFSYTVATTELMGRIADALYRAGDNELYEFKTSRGVNGTEGGEKSFLLVLRTMCELLDDSFEPIYAYQKTEEYRINGKHNGRIWAYNMWFTQYNKYYNDPLISSSYKRALNSSLSKASIGPHSVYNSVGGAFPSKLFMFGE